MALTNGFAARVGAALLTAQVAMIGWLAVQAGGDSQDDLSAPSGQGRAWHVDGGLRTEILARLPAAFEPRARDAQERFHGLVVPSSSRDSVWMHGGTRHGGLRMVTVDGACSHPPGVAPSPAPQADDSTPAPAFPSPDAGCYFSGAYDPDAHRFVSMSVGDTQPEGPTGRIDCARDRFQAVTRLRDLPAQVQASLRGPAELAERGEPMRMTDVVSDPSEATRRFVMAALAPDRAIVVVEHGGYAYGIAYWLIERHDGYWEGGPRWDGGPPNSLQALLHVACSGVPSPPMRGLATADLVGGRDEADGYHLMLGGEQYGYVLHANGEVVADTFNGQVLSIEERRALRLHLSDLRAEVLRDQPAHAALTRVLSALERESPAPSAARPVQPAAASSGNPT